MGTAHSAPMGQHLDSLESLDEALKRLGLETAIGVGDEGPGQAWYPRVALERERGASTPSMARLQRLAKPGACR
jgi:hypothetical protein